MSGNKGLVFRRLGLQGLEQFRCSLVRSNVTRPCSCRPNLVDGGSCAVSALVQNSIVFAPRQASQQEGVLRSFVSVGLPRS